MDFREGGGLNQTILSYFQHIQGRKQNELPGKGAILLHALVCAKGYVKPLFSLCHNKRRELRPCR